MPYLGLVQLIGKYVFLAGMYVFLIWAFRELFRTLRFEQSAARGVPATLPSAGAATARRQAPAAPPVAAAVAPAAPAAPAAQPLVRERPHTRSTPALIVRDAGGAGLTAGTVFPITAAVTIGRAKENSIRISDRFASAQHAIIFLKNGRRILRDRGSTNGTTRNGKRIAGEVALNNGDIVGVGTVLLEYRSDGTN